MKACYFKTVGIIVGHERATSEGEKMTLKPSIILLILAFLAACGGGSGDNDVSQIDQDPVDDLATIVSNGIAIKRTNNPNEAVLWTEWSDNSRLIWFDTDIGVEEESSLVPGTTIFNSNSIIEIQKGDTTGDDMMMVYIPEAPTSRPIVSLPPKTDP